MQKGGGPNFITLLSMKYSLAYLTVTGIKQDVYDKIVADSVHVISASVLPCKPTPNSCLSEVGGGQYHILKPLCICDGDLI